MRFKIEYSEIIESDTRDEAVKAFMEKHPSLNNDGTITSEPLCPKNRDKSGSCYEMCAFRENGMCNLDFEV